MDDVHFLEDGGTIVCDKSFASCVLDHFVHTSGTETGSDAISDGFGGLNVGSSDVFGFLVFIVRGLLGLLGGFSHAVLDILY
jgi:hypothetical protein